VFVHVGGGYDLGPETDNQKQGLGQGREEGSGWLFAKILDNILTE